MLSPQTEPSSVALGSGRHDSIRQSRSDTGGSRNPSSIDAVPDQDQQLAPATRRLTTEELSDNPLPSSTRARDPPEATEDFRIVWHDIFATLIVRLVETSTSLVQERKLAESTTNADFGCMMAPFDREKDWITEENFQVRVLQLQETKELALYKYDRSSDEWLHRKTFCLQPVREEEPSQLPTWLQRCCSKRRSTSSQPRLSDEGYGSINMKLFESFIRAHPPHRTVARTTSRSRSPRRNDVHPAVRSRSPVRQQSNTTFPRPLPERNSWAEMKMRSEKIDNWIIRQVFGQEWSNYQPTLPRQDTTAFNHQAQGSTAVVSQNPLPPVSTAVLSQSHTPPGYMARVFQDLPLPVPAAVVSKSHHLPLASTATASQNLLPPVPTAVVSSESMTRRESEETLGTESPIIPVTDAGTQQTQTDLPLSLGLHSPQNPISHPRPWLLQQPISFLRERTSYMRTVRNPYTI